MSKKGQSTLEYVVVWTAIVSAILFAAEEYLKPAVEDALAQASGKIKEEVEDFVSGIGK